MLLDAAFRVPGTSIRFGLDPILGLVPGLGDLTSPIYTALILLEAFRRRVPPIVQARMVLNSAIDTIAGLVPLLGDIVDAFWKANLRNIALLERHTRSNVPPSTGDYAFVFLCLAVVALIALLPIALLVWVITRFSAI